MLLNHRCLAYPSVKVCKTVYITKTHLCKCIENFTAKNWNFSDKNSDIFHFSAQNIDCRYSLEPPRRGGSNEYPQSMFLTRNKKNNIYPCKPQFYYIKVGFKGVKLYWYVFVMRARSVRKNINNFRSNEECSGVLIYLVHCLSYFKENYFRDFLFGFLHPKIFFKFRIYRMYLADKPVQTVEEKRIQQIHRVNTVVQNKYGKELGYPTT